ncbi:MAG: DUF374 domain-containing protein [Caulobacteraceae bacterium]|nr:DUF374 domain-containing protein [Caulobacteraceae bacterium]
MRPLRHPLAQSILSWLLTGYFQLVTVTMRWRYENVGELKARLINTEGTIACLWHSRLGIGIVGRGVLEKKSRQVLISLSPDGEFIAKAVDRLGIPSIRGSADKKGKNVSKGGAAALRESLVYLKRKGMILITPDGPRGPAEVMRDGPVILSEVAQVPVIFAAFAAKPTLNLKSWDRTRIPLPFSQGCLVVARADAPPRGSSPEEREAILAEWQKRMSAAQARADELLGLKPL